LHCFKNTNAINLYGAFYENKMLAAVIFFNYKNVAIYAYGASRSDREMFKLGLNQAVMWEAIKHSYENQIKIVDFGSTPRYNKNLIDYKSKWNCTISDLVYSYYNPNNKKSKGINREGFVAKTISQVIKQSPSNIISKISPIVFKQIL
jgi:lipid II:glycine glycyltransferase (peptidoglycan interpeptide bridge formation enzyme)